MLTFREFLTEKETNKEIMNILIDMTKEIEEKSFLWVKKAITDKKELDKTLYDDVNAILDKKYGIDHSREKTYAQPNIMSEYIENKMGIDRYKGAQYFTDRGIGGNDSKIREIIKKDFDKKRESLLSKIEKLKGSNNIEKITDITSEVNGTLGCYAMLDNNTRIEIKTISAGGWNIQRYHFRGTAKLLKR